MAARGTWSVYTSVDNGSNWTADGSIYRPNENMSLDLISTQSRIDLADGSRAYVTPETKYNKEPLVFMFLEIENSDAIRTKLENYVINQNYLKITTHLSEDFIGRFTYIRRVWITGTEDHYDLEVGFERMV